MHERKDKWSVGQWMTSNPAVITPSDSVLTAFIKMKREGYRHLVVVEDGEVVGIVSDRDLRRPDMPGKSDDVDNYYRLDDDYDISYVMTTNVYTVTSQDSLEKALKLFIEHKFSSLPVLDRKKKLIGILTAHDALRAFSAAMDQVGDILHKG